MGESKERIWWLPSWRKCDPFSILGLRLRLFWLQTDSENVFSEKGMFGYY